MVCMAARSGLICMPARMQHVWGGYDKAQHCSIQAPDCGGAHMYHPMHGPTHSAARGMVSCIPEFLAVCAPILCTGRNCRRTCAEIGFHVYSAASGSAVSHSTIGRLCLDSAFTTTERVWKQVEARFIPSLLAKHEIALYACSMPDAMALLHPDRISVLVGYPVATPLSIISQARRLICIHN